MNSVTIGLIGLSAVSCFCYNYYYQIQNQTLIPSILQVTIAATIIYVVNYIKKKLQSKIKSDQYQDVPKEESIQDLSDKDQELKQKQKINRILREIEPNKKKNQKDLKIEEIFIKEDLLLTFAEQKGNVCGATSVTTCMNYLLKYKLTDKQRITTRDAQQIYHLIFRSRMEKNKQMLQKYIKDQQQLETMLEMINDKQILSLTSDNKKQEFFTLIKQKLNLCSEPLSLSHNHQIDLLRKYLLSIESLYKIYNPNTLRCTTWVIGNDLIALCIKALGYKQNVIGKVVNWMGNANSFINLNQKDDQIKINEQYEQLKTEIDKDDSILFYHIDNHYTLIYGYRTVTKESTLFKQILTSRWGQRPKHWVDFQHSWLKYDPLKENKKYKKSVRDCLIGWAGYKILKVSLITKQRMMDKDMVEAKRLAAQALGEESQINQEMVERIISEGEKDCSDIEA